MVVALDAATAGAAGERDAVSGFEGVDGGAGDDRLLGRPDEADVMRGGPGDDRIEGRGASSGPYTQTLSGGPGDDVLVGSAAPEIFAGEGGRDDVRCRGGRDSVFIRRGDYVHTACEEMVYRLHPVRSHPTSYGAADATFAVTCPANGALADERPFCAGQVLLREAAGRRRRIGAGAFAHRGDRERFAVRVRLTRAGPRLVRRSRGVIVTVAIRAQYGHPDLRWRIRLRRR